MRRLNPWPCKQMRSDALSRISVNRTNEFQRAPVCRTRVKKLMREERMKVLVAEDDSITSHLLQALLTKAGYEPIAVGDGEQVLAMLDQPDRPRLMILDWMMPNVDGVLVCRAIRKNNSDHYVYL